MARLNGDEGQRGQGVAVEHPGRAQLQQLGVDQVFSSDRSSGGRELEEELLEVEVLGGHLVDHERRRRRRSGRRRRWWCPSATTRVGGLAPRRRCRWAARASRSASALRCPHPHAGRGLVGQIGQRGLGDQSSVGDDDHVVDGLGDLGQQVARHQHRAALVGVGTQELSQPVDALGVEAVGRLVEDEHLGFARAGPRPGRGAGASRARSP